MNKLEYASFNWLAHKINNRSLEKYLHLVKGEVLDLGCGLSPYKEDILNVSEKYTGVDWGNSFHDSKNVDVFTNLNARLPFNDASTDTVVSFQVMEHLSEPDVFLSECHRLLRDQGLLLMTVPFMWHVHEAPYDFYRYTRHGLEYLLKKHGFSQINIEENTGFWQMWVLKFNYHSLRFAPGLFRYFWIPIWWIGQVVSPLLDKYDPHPDETASYTVIARKT